MTDKQFERLMDNTALNFIITVLIMLVLFVVMVAINGVYTLDIKQQCVQKEKE